MIETGRPVEADEARDWGLVNEVTDEGDALESAVETAESIASFPQETVRTDRASVYDGLGKSLEDGMRIEAWHGSRSLSTGYEGAQRFAEGEGRGGEGIE